MSALAYANLALDIVNVVVALGLGAVYWRNHREIRSPFTFGLLLFAAFLILHNAVSVYHFVTMMDAMGSNETWLTLGENLLQAGAGIALVAATMR